MTFTQTKYIAYCISPGKTEGTYLSKLFKTSYQSISTQAMDTENKVIKICQIDGAKKTIEDSVEILKKNLKKLVDQEKDHPEQIDNKYFFIVVTDFDKRKNNTVKLEDLTTLETKLKGTIEFFLTSDKYKFFFIANINQLEHWLRFCLEQDNSNTEILSKKKGTLINHITNNSLWDKHFSNKHKTLKNTFNSSCSHNIVFLDSYSVDYPKLDISENFYSDFPRFINFIQQEIGEFPKDPPKKYNLIQSK